MGLFWSMVPSPGERLGVRFILRDATKPMVVQLSLYEGLLDTAALQTTEPKATAAAERWYMGKDVERIEVEYGQVRGALFKPKGTYYKHSLTTDTGHLVYLNICTK